MGTAPAIYEQVLISHGPRARGAVLKGMIPAYERKVSDLLDTVKFGSMDALDKDAAGTVRQQKPAAGSSTRPGRVGDPPPHGRIRCRQIS